MPDSPVPAHARPGVRCRPRCSRPERAAAAPPQRARSWRPTARCCASSSSSSAPSTTCCCSRPRARARSSRSTRTWSSPAIACCASRRGAFGDRWVAMARGLRRRCDGRWSASGAARPIPRWSPRRWPTRRCGSPSSCTRETSTATVTDIQAIGERTRGRSCLLAIDAVSSLGAVPIETDAWGLDVRRLGHAEGHVDAARPLVRERLAGAPGSAAAQTKTPRFYFDWKRTLRRPERRRQPVHARDRDRERARRGARPRARRRASRRSGSAREALARPLPRARARHRASSSTRPTTTSCSLVTGDRGARGRRRATSCAARCSRPATSSRAAAAGRRARCCASGISARPTRRALNAGLDALLAALPQ